MTEQNNNQPIQNTFENSQEFQELSAEKADVPLIEKLTTEQAIELAPEITAIYRDTWIATYPNDELGITEEDLREHFGNFDEVVDDWKAHILGAPDRTVWIAKTGEKVAGFCVARQAAEESELEYLYTLPKSQGSGIGTALMEQALAQLGNNKPIVLYGAAYNDKAINFYRRFGFELVDEKLPPKVLKNGKHLPSMKMLKV